MAQPEGVGNTGQSRRAVVHRGCALLQRRPGIHYPVIPGHAKRELWCAICIWESRDSGFDAAHRPGM